mgnify:CR=1 FL=1
MLRQCSDECQVDYFRRKLCQLKRMGYHCTLFAEMLHAQQSLVSRDEDKTYRAVGVEASFNLCPLRINFALNIGFRATLSDAPAGSGVEMVLNVPYL